MIKTIAFCCSVFLSVASSSAAVKDLDLYLLIGQSNMAGRGKLTKENRVSAERVLKLENNGRWVEAREPLHLDKPSAGAGLGASFARTMADADPSVTVGLIPCAFGGTSLGEWMPGRYLYNQAVLRAREAMKRGNLKGILWHQGEADACSPKNAAGYADRLVTMMTALRKDLAAEDVPVVVGELAPYLDEFVAAKGEMCDWKTVNGQLHEVAKRLPKCGCASAEGLNEHIGDKLHFSTAAQREFGRRYAEILKGLSKCK